MSEGSRPPIKQNHLICSKLTPLPKPLQAKSYRNAKIVCKLLILNRIIFVEEWQIVVPGYVRGENWR